MACLYSLACVFSFLMLYVEMSELRSSVKVEEDVLGSLSVTE